MGMMLRRYHAAKKERFNKQEVIEEAEQQMALSNETSLEETDDEIEKPVYQKRTYTKRSE